MIFSSFIGFNLLWMILIISIVVFIFEYSIHSQLLLFFIFIISVSLSISLEDLNSWMSVILVIFLIGGLMVSFVYMVSLIPNNMNKKVFSIFIFGWMIAVNSREEVITMNSSKLLWFWEDNYSQFLFMVVMFLLYLIIILMFVDNKLKFIYGTMKEIY